MTDDLRPFPDNNDALITRSQLTQYLPLTSQTLARWKYEGKGPRCVRLGKVSVYRVADVKEWLRRELANER